MPALADLPVLDWATAEDARLLSDALSHYAPETLTEGLAKPLAAGEIRLYWPGADAEPLPATYGALLAAEAFYKQSDRLQRRADRTEASRANVLGMALAGGRLMFWNRAADGRIRNSDGRTSLVA